MYGDYDKCMIARENGETGDARVAAAPSTRSRSPEHLYRYRSLRFACERAARVTLRRFLSTSCARGIMRRDGEAEKA